MLVKVCYKRQEEDADVDVKQTSLFELESHSLSEGFF